MTPKTDRPSVCAIHKRPWELCTGCLLARATSAEAKHAREVELHGFTIDEKIEAQQEVEYLNNRVQAAEAARDTLAKYAQHKPKCAALNSYRRDERGVMYYEPGRPCDCGLAAVLTGEAPTPQGSSNEVTCPLCRGQGQFQGAFSKVTCSRCDGHGTVVPAVEPHK